jgi:hypothetical protein
MDNSSLSNKLKNFGYAVFGLGVVAGILVLVKLSEGGLFSKPDINPTAVIVAFLVAFYHGVFGILCLGLSALLNQTIQPVSVAPQSINNPSQSIKKLKCPKCRKEFASDFSGESCDECGTQLFKCKKCSKQYMPAFAGEFCEECGAKL